jgi:pimeloyl-ACP methyl ester carboxylesterase
MGWAGAVDSWTDDFLSALSARRPVIAIDPPGTGRASKDINKERLHPSLAAEDIVGVLDELGVRTCHLLGYSWGGVLAMESALLAAARIKTLILVATTGGAKLYTSPPRSVLAALAAPAGQTIEEKTESIWKVCLGADALEKFRPAMNLVTARQKNAPTPSWVLREQLGHYMAFDLGDRGSSLQMPTMVITGSEDPLTPAQNSVDLAQVIEGSQLKLLEGIRHMPHIECSESFATTILNFIEETENCGVLG